MNVEQRHIEAAKQYYSGAFLCEAVLAEAFARFEERLSQPPKDQTNEPG